MNNPNKSGIRISAVTIAKNEEQNIGRWLQSVKHYADEVIVVDTGSTDNTVSIAEAAGARVAYFPWINDFAAAKNFALEQATGQWIAFFDADEYYSDEDAKKVRPLLERLNPRLRTVGVMQKLLNIDKDKHNSLISMTYQLRLFRRLPDIMYKGKIHEGLTGIKEKHRDLFMDEELKILHTGYSSSLVKEKCQRNLEVLLKEISSRGHRAGDYNYLSDCYYGMGDYEKAIDYAEKHISSGEILAADETSTHINLITSRYILNQPTARILPDCQRAIKLFPQTASFQLLLGISYFRENDYPASARWFDEGFNLLKNAQQQAKLDPVAKVTGANTGENFLPISYFQRGLIYEFQGNLAKALEYVSASLKEYPFNSEYLSELLKLLAGKYPSEIIIERLSALYSTGDESIICQALQPILNRYPVLAEVYSHFAATAGYPTDSPLLSLAKGDYEMTAQAAAQNLSAACCFGIAAALKSGSRQTMSPISLYATEPLKQAWWYLDRGEPVPAKLFSAPGVKELTVLVRQY